MKYKTLFRRALLGLVLIGFMPVSYIYAQSNPADYLKEVKDQLKIEWPGNRTINLVFHGHSVPAGYFKTPTVNTLDSYPYQVLSELKKNYPLAVINVINTAIGGENSEQGARRFAKEVLIHQPDVIFIDYALNDRGIGLDRAAVAWESMIKQALKKHIKVILLTPSPDQNVNIIEPDNTLEQHANQIRALAKKFNIGLADSFLSFQNVVRSGQPLTDYMSQVNHPNKKGHTLIMQEIIPFFM